MKKHFITLILALFSSAVWAQGIYNNGGKIVIGSGIFLYVNGPSGNYRNETNVTDGSLDLSGNLLISGNLTNNAVADFIGTTTPAAQVVLVGTTLQTLGGTSTSPFQFSNLTLNNSLGAALTKNASINGNLTFTSGLLDIANTTFSFGPQAIVAGTPSSSSMILATGTGQVEKAWTTTGSFTYPVGDKGSTANYSPVTLNFSSGTFATGAVAGVNLVAGKYNDPAVTGSYLNRYWNLTQSGITSFSCNARFQYVPTDVVGTEANINTLRIAPPPVTVFNAADATLHQLSATGLTSLGTFTGAPGNKTLNLTGVMLQSLYSSAGVMRQAMDAAGPHWPAGVADHITVELHSAVAGSYSTVIYSIADIPLSTTGNATITIPGTYNGSYYITIKHRNSITTCSAAPISFAASTINQSFNATAQVYGGNVVRSADGYYLIYGGDANGDGIVDSSDMNMVDNGSTAILTGYTPGDVNGDGIVDTSDMNMVDNNSTAIVMVHLPL